MAYLFLVLISSVGIAAVLGLKIAELKSGKAGALSRWSAVADPVINRKIKEGFELAGRISKSNVEKVLKQVVYFLFDVFGVTGLFVSKYHARFKNWLKGKKFLKGRGVVSFFLKDVAESREKKKDL